MLHNIVAPYLNPPQVKISVTNWRMAFPVYVSLMLAHNKTVTRICQTWIRNLLSLFRIEGSLIACSRINLVASRYCERCRWRNKARYKIKSYVRNALKKSPVITYSLNSQMHPIRCTNLSIPSLHRHRHLPQWMRLLWQLNLEWQNEPISKSIVSIFWTKHCMCTNAWGVLETYLPFHLCGTTTLHKQVDFFFRTPLFSKFVNILCNLQK